MGRTARSGGRTGRRLDARPDSDLPGTYVKPSEGRSNESISQPPKTYRPPGRKSERGLDPHSHSRQHRSRESRAELRVDQRTSYRPGGTAWDDSIGPAVFSDHRLRQSVRSPTGDRVFFKVGIDTKRHSTRAKFTLPKPPGEAYFTSSRQPRTSQDHSRSKIRGRQLGAQVPRTDDYHKEVRTEYSSEARRDPRERMSEGTRKSSRRDRDYYTAPKLTMENVASNARSASLSYLPGNTAAPTRPPLTAHATTTPRRTSRSKQKTRDPPASRVPNQRGENSRGETKESSVRGDTYPSKPRGDKVSRGRRMDSKHSRNAPIASGGDQKEPTAHRPRSPTPPPLDDRPSKRAHTKRRSSNDRNKIPEEVGIEPSPPTSDISAHTDFSYEYRRTTRRKQSHQTTCQCSVS